VTSESTLYDLMMKQGGTAELKLQLDTSATARNNSWTPPSPSRSTLSLRLEYFEFSAQHLSNSLSEATIRTPALLSVKLYHIAGLPFEYAKGVRIRVRVGNDEKQSKKSKSIHPKEYFGFGMRQSQIMHKLHKGGASIDAIASAYELTAEIVEEVISVESGIPSRFGWDETLHMLVDDPEKVLACVEMERPRGATSSRSLGTSSRSLAGSAKWLPLGHHEGQLTQVFNSIMDVDKEGGPGGGKLSNVLDYPEGRVSVGLAMELTPAVPLTNDKAMSLFKVGRLGGEATRRGAEQLMREATRRGAEQLMRCDQGSTSPRQPPRERLLSFGMPAGTDPGLQNVMVQSTTTCNPLQACWRKWP